MEGPRVETLAPGAQATTTERVLRLLVAGGPQHRAAIARSLGISRSRVTAVVSELMAQGCLVEQERTEADSTMDGRAGPALQVRRDFGAVAGIQITTRRVAVAVTSLSGEALAQKSAPMPSASVERVLDLATELVAQARTEARVSALSAVGVGFFGQVDPRTGVASTHPGNRWSGVHIGEAIEAALGVRAVVENNSRLEALAEAQWGAGQGADPLLYLHLSVGLTATVVIGGQPLRGAHGGAGELGHVSIDPLGPLCDCGSRGCLMLYASSAVVEKSLDASSFTEALELLSAGDRRAVRAFREVATAIGRATATIATLIDPALIVVGGDFGRAGDSFLEQLAAQHRENSYHASRGTDFKLAEFDDTGGGGARSAALLARQSVDLHLGDSLTAAAGGPAPTTER